MMETVEESERDQVSAKATSISPLSLRSHSPTNAVAGQHALGMQYGLSPEVMDVLVKYVALPKFEKRRPESKEMDAVWPAWKKELE